MKHIRLFENYDDRMSPKDIETIENCFLQYIDEGRCTSSSINTAVLFYFESPESIAKLYAEWYMEEQADARRLIWHKYKENMHLWAEDLKEELSTDIIRCESYGYSCSIWVPSDNPEFGCRDVILSVYKRNND